MPINMKIVNCPICYGNAILWGPTIRCQKCAGVSMTNRETTAVYDEEYVAKRYDTYPRLREMSKLRLAVIERAIEQYTDDYNHTLLDVGYGNGDFIRHARHFGWDAYGNDVNPTPYSGVRTRPLPETYHDEDYEVITFFDSLEHFENLGSVRLVARCAKYIVVSHPTIPRSFREWTSDVENPPHWHHYRPGEHHYHFTPYTLAKLFTNGTSTATPIYIGNPEDEIRGALPTGEPNITTTILKIHNYA